MNKQIRKILITALLILPFILYGLPNIFMLLILGFLCFFEGALLKMYWLQIKARNIKKANKRVLLLIALCIYLVYQNTVEKYSATGFKVSYLLLFILGLIPNYDDENQNQEDAKNLIEE